MMGFCVVLYVINLPIRHHFIGFRQYRGRARERIIVVLDDESLAFIIAGVGDKREAKGLFI